MEILDRDLQSIQEARDLIRKAEEAQDKYAMFSAEEVNRIVKAVAKVASNESESLAILAVEETGYGNIKDKTAKNKLASDRLYDYIKDMKTVGVINEDMEKGVVDIGTPLGVITALIPSTNPTSTTIYKALIALKSGNAIIFSPHPGAHKCIMKTVEILEKACVENGAPKGLISCLSIITMEATTELMENRHVATILATGGSAMVRAAYSSGNPALGVGPGNVPAYIERTADVEKAVSRIFASKTFDNGTICASEQSIITEKIIEEKVKEEIVKQGGYFLSGDKLEKVVKIMETHSGSMNPVIVGKTAKDIALMAGIEIPNNTRVLLCEEKGVGKEYPFSKEKLTSLLGFYSIENWQGAHDLSLKLLRYGGLGHSLVIHSNSEEMIRQFSSHIPVSRILVNTPSSQGAVGITTNLAPSLTLGSGAVGGSASSDNITPMNLINIRRIAYGIEEIEDISQELNTSKEIKDIDIDTITKIIVEKIKELSN